MLYHQRGDAGKNVFQSLKGVGKGMGLLSRLLHQFVGTKLKTASGDEEIVMLESLLTWNCWPSYINNFCELFLGHGFKGMLSKPGRVVQRGHSQGRRRVTGWGGGGRFRFPEEKIQKKCLNRSQVWCTSASKVTYFPD